MRTPPGVLSVEPVVAPHFEPSQTSRATATKEALARLRGVSSNHDLADQIPVELCRAGFGRVPPSDFIPVAEASALINDLGRWVLGRAAQQLAIPRSTLANWLRGQGPGC